MHLPGRPLASRTNRFIVRILRRHVDSVRPFHCLQDHQSGKAKLDRDSIVRHLISFLLLAV
jgi:hypothetical protein